MRTTQPMTNAKATNLNTVLYEQPAGELMTLFCCTGLTLLRLDTADIDCNTDQVLCTNRTGLFPGTGAKM